MEGLRPEDRTHKVNHDEEVNAKAQERFESGYEGEKADLFGEKQDWDDTDTVLAHKIIVNEVAKARESGSKDAYAEVAKLMKEWDAHGTEAGQALRQRRQLASDPALMEADAIQLLNDSERTRKMSDEQRKKILDSVSQNAEKLRSIRKGDVDGVVDLIKDMNKAEIYDLLRTRGIWHEITEHKAVYNMAELTDVALPYPEADAKNLFVRDDKKRNYYLITVRGDKRVDLKEFRHRYGTRALSFASENDLMQVLGLIPGAVTPLGLLNDAECKVQLYLDEAFFAAPGLIGVHPNDNTATVWLRADDLAALIQEHGNPVHIAEL